MDEIKLTQMVNIKAINTKAEVIGIWHDKFGETQYHVRYYDTTNSKADTWLTAGELEAAPE